MESWKVKITKTGLPAVNGAETLMWRVFAIYFIYFKYFIYSMFHFLSVWGMKSSFSLETLIFHINLEH